MVFVPNFAWGAESFPAFPMSFYGTAKLNNALLENGAKIRAYNGNDLLGEATIQENGIYGYNSSTKSRLLVWEFTGDLLFKYVLAGSNEELTGDSNITYSGGFVSGAALSFDISFSKAEPTPPPAPSGGGGGGGGGGGAPADTTAPAKPSQFAAARKAGLITLSWTNPTVSDFSKVIIVRDTKNISDTIPGNTLKNHGVVIYEGNLNAFEDKSIIDDTVYYYAISAYDNNKNYSLPLVLAVPLIGDTNASSLDAEEEVEVLGVEHADYSAYKTLYGLEGSLVDAISQSEAEAVANIAGETDLNEVNQKIYDRIVNNFTDELADSIKRAVAYFIQTGTLTTQSLGAGERAGALNSYVSAFGSFPETIAQWQDVIKIANGRWPTQRNQAAEDGAALKFKQIYLRAPDMNNPHDNAAVTIIAYGLRPADRNMNSEKAAINIFKGIFKYNPVSAIDWDMVRAIAYSGAKR